MPTQKQAEYLALAIEKGAGSQCVAIDLFSDLPVRLRHAVSTRCEHTALLQTANGLMIAGLVISKDELRQRVLGERCGKAIACRPAFGAYA